MTPAPTTTPVIGGAILRQGAPAEIAEDPEVREVYLGKNFRLG